MKRGRPKGIAKKDKQSFGPLGDLIRKHRFEQGLGLADVAKACNCSVQFVSNIEHGRAPLPWDKIGSLSTILKISLEDVQIANLAVRSDFQSLANTSASGKKVKKPAILKNMTGMASTFAFAVKNDEFQELVQKYQAASPASRKKFVKMALEMLTH